MKRRDDEAGPGSGQPAGDPGARTTVVIATRNRSRELLDTLRRHEGPVVVVDNASTDGTSSLVAAECPHVKVVRLARNHGAWARTVGAQVANTPFVAFADDDSWWEPGAIATAEAAFDAHPRLALVAGSVLVGEQGRPDPMNEILASSPLPVAADGLGPALLGFVCCAAVVRRDAFLQVGGFDRVVRFPGEEERVALDLDDAGWQLAYVPQAVARHVPSPHRSDPEARQRAVIRSTLLTAVMRYPGPRLARRLAAAARTRRGRRALLATLPSVPAAVWHRRVVGLPTQHRLALLEQGR